MSLDKDLQEMFRRIERESKATASTERLDAVTGGKTQRRWVPVFAVVLLVPVLVALLALNTRQEAQPVATTPIEIVVPVTTTTTIPPTTTTTTTVPLPDDLSQDEEMFQDGFIDFSGGSR